MNKYLVFYIILFFCLSCSHTSEKTCSTLLRKANDNLYQFYLSHDTTLLITAKNCLDSIDCNSLKYKVFNTKISVFILLKEYSEGIEYIESLNADDFNREYQKDMYLKSFAAMQSELRGDTVMSIKRYAEVVAEIQDYLDKDSNEEALTDLFFIKSKIEKREKIIQEIELLKKTGKYDDNLLNAIITGTTDINNKNSYEESLENNDNH